MKKSKKGYFDGVAVKARRKGVLLRLEAQLKSGVKNTKEGEVPLTDQDIKRINKEMQTLKERLGLLKPESHDGV